MRSIGVQNDGSFALRSPDTVQGVQLTTSPQQVAVPVGATHAFFASEVNFAVAYNATVGTTTASFSTAATSACELNPTVRYLGKGGTTNGINELSLIGRSSGYASISFFNSGST